MSAMDLQQVGAGFSDPAIAGQAVFRSALHALSRPGRVQTVRTDAQLPAGVDPAAGAMLLALLDPDCSLWLSPALAAGPVPQYLRFHTGCTLVERPDAARFAWVASPAELPRLDVFALGSEFEPEFSTTCILQVDALDDASGWTLRGPGIHDHQRLAAAGLGADFVAQWRANHALFPRGIDLLLCADDRLAGLARTTAIED